MFGNTKKDSTAAENEIIEQVGTIIGPGAVIDGPLTTKDSTRVDGTIKGNVNISGALIVGQEGRIFGTASGVNIYVAGEVNGNVTAPQGKVEISDTGKVVGDIICKGIIIDENAVFQGRCEMTGLDKNSAEIAKERAAANKETNDAENNSEENNNENKDSDNN